MCRTDNTGGYYNTRRSCVCKIILLLLNVVPHITEFDKQSPMRQALNTILSLHSLFFLLVKKIWRAQAKAAATRWALCSCTRSGLYTTGSWFAKTRHKEQCERQTQHKVISSSHETTLQKCADAVSAHSGGRHSTAARRQELKRVECLLFHAKWLM